MSGQGRTGPNANYQTAVISNELTSGIIGQIADVRNQIANKLEGGVGIVPGIAREGAPEGTVHESDGVMYEKKGGTWEDIDAPVIKESSMGAAEPSTLPTRDAPSEEIISSGGL